MEQIALVQKLYSRRLCLFLFFSHFSASKTRTNYSLFLINY